MQVKHWFETLTPKEVRKMKRTTLLDLLQSNDRNGVYTDLQSRENGLPIMRKSEAVAKALEIIAEYHN